MTREEKTPLLITAILHGFCILNAADELGHDYIKLETKQLLNRFIQTFMKNHKAQIESMFDTKTDHSENRVDALIEGQTIVEMLGKSLSTIPYHRFPELLNLIEGFKEGTVVTEKEFKEVAK